MKRISIAIPLLLAIVAAAIAQNGPHGNAPATSSPQSQTEFYAAADEVLGVMSKILDLPAKSPLKKSIRTKPEIRAYLVAEQKKDEPASKQYIDQRTLEAFGFIPKDFPLQTYLLNLLTDQVAGLYDPKSKSFFIADWIPPLEQKPVMAHELTHALDDQYFHLQKWQKAVESNDDASMARDAVAEGSATASMMDYMFSGLHVSVRQMPDIAPFIQSGMASEMTKDPNIAKAPIFIRDELLFPYLAGAVFTQQFLKANSGWPDFKKVFEKPPVSTQQILHPKLYLQGVKPRAVTLPHLGSAIPHGWKKLDENVVGEFALGELFKQFLGEDQATKFSPMWAGDRYALFEDKKTKVTLVIVLYAIHNTSDTAKFYSAYRDLLAKKYGVTKFAQEAPEFAETDRAFLDCVQDECLTVEGPTSDVTSSVATQMMRNLNWPSLPLAQAPDNGATPSPGSHSPSHSRP
ncbi:MAG TPA: hypothetical protein VJN21_01070 [Candidatus Acidoferrales bacterium]|nr:hypothetical protein [Candidatus Acidoferrales bacterium]